MKKKKREKMLLENYFEYRIFILKVLYHGVSAHAYNLHGNHYVFRWLFFK